MNSGMGMSLRQAALVAGFTSFAPLLLGGVPFAEFYVFAKLIVPGDTAETISNVQANRGLFLTGVFALVKREPGNGALDSDVKWQSVMRGMLQVGVLRLSQIHPQVTPTSRSRLNDDTCCAC